MLRVRLTQHDRDRKAKLVESTVRVRLEVREVKVKIRGGGA